MTGETSKRCFLNTSGGEPNNKQCLHCKGRYEASFGLKRRKYATSKLLMVQQLHNPTAEEVISRFVTCRGALFDNYIKE